MVKPFHIILFVTCCLVYGACGGNNDEEALAQVGDKYLYRSDLEGLIPQGMTRQDSITRAKNYVNNWINRQILLQKATQELKGSMDKIERQVMSYRQDLILAEYEQEYLSSKLDTTVTASQVEDFYNENRSMFELRDYVVNVFYLKFDVNEKDIDRIGTEMRKCPDAESAAELDKKYSVMAVNSYYEPGSWLFLNDLLREIPMEIEDKTRFLENNAYVEVRKDEFVYLVRIFEYKLRNDTAPLNLVKNKIKTLILRKRSKELLGKMRSETIEKYRHENDVQQ